MSYISDKSKKWFIGIDVGGTTISTLLVDHKHIPHASLTTLTDVSTPELTLVSIIAAIKQTLHNAGLKLKDLTAVGLGVPGQIDRNSGVVDLAVNLNWYNFPAVKLLSNHLNTPCFLENDVRTATLGVYYFNNEQSAQNLAYVSIGTGVAAGIMLNGKLYRGSHGMAGEIGHIVHDINGELCNCGARGCLETFIAGPAIVRQGQQALQNGMETMLPKNNPISAKNVYQAALRDDPVALNITEKAGHYLGMALHSLVMSYDIDHIVLGGGLTQAGDAFLQPILREWSRQCRQSPLAQKMLRPNILQLTPPDKNMGAWGAVALAEQGLKQQKNSDSLVLRGVSLKDGHFSPQVKARDWVH